MAPPELDSPSHSSLSGLKLMAKSWETWREGGGSWCTPYHSPWHLPSPTSATAEGTQRDERVPGVPQGPGHLRPPHLVLGGDPGTKAQRREFLIAAREGV